MRDDLSEGLNKTLTIARTEQLRVYRQAGLDQYKASGVVEGQKRLAAHDGRVCAACIADEGTVYPLEATISDHPQGRCTAVPMVRDMPEVKWLSGEAWFRQQERATQLSILGKGRLDAYEAGQFKFADLVVHRQDATWGGSIVPRGLKELVQ
jgi:hypothetical protein